jgi:predicted DCC family thiol-disulfide oxidoreductase YuxK
VKVIVYDGHCNFCNGWVRFVMKHDSVGKFRYASAQSIAGSAILARIGLDSTDLRTIVLLDGSRYYEKSEAVFGILEGLGGFWSLLRVFRAVPRRVRDTGYTAFAQRRYRWFGRSESCDVPDAKWRNRYLE